MSERCIQIFDRTMSQQYLALYFHRNLYIKDTFSEIKKGGTYLSHSWKILISFKDLSFIIGRGSQLALMFGGKKNTSPFKMY